MNKMESFAREVLECICDEQNVGSNSSSVPFVDPKEAFARIVTLAFEKKLLTQNKQNGLLIPTVNLTQDHSGSDKPDLL
jgi:hypothetical protein